MLYAAFYVRASKVSLFEEERKEAHQGLLLIVDEVLVAHDVQGVILSLTLFNKSVKVAPYLPGPLLDELVPVLRIVSIELELRLIAVAYRVTQSCQRG